MCNFEEQIAMDEKRESNMAKVFERDNDRISRR